jgi:dihydroflavonol-4-reductase
LDFTAILHLEVKASKDSRVNLKFAQTVDLMTLEQRPLEPGSTKVLVTGGTGFLGAYILKELVAKGYQAKAIRRTQKTPFFIPAEMLAPVQWVDGDILDCVSVEEAMKGSDMVIHAAAKVSYSGGDQKQLYKTNIEGTSNVVNAALDQGIKKFVYVSSVAALGRSMDGATVSEGKQWDEITLDTHYARSKYHAEMEVWRGIAEGLDAVIVNPSTILGYGDWNQSSCAIFKNVYQEFPWYTNGVNGFVDVEDIAKIVVMMLKTAIHSERFILSGDTLSFRQLFDLIADGMKKKHPHWEATPAMAAVAWRLESIKSLFSSKRSVLTRESAKIATSKTYFDNSKILQYLPDFAFTPLAQTINRTCAAYLSQVQPSS